MRPSQPRRRVSVLQGGHRRVQPLRWWQGATGYGGHVPAGTLTLCAATAATGLQNRPVYLQRGSTAHRASRLRRERLEFGNSNCWSFFYRCSRVSQRRAGLDFMHGTCHVISPSWGGGTDRCTAGMKPRSCSCSRPVPVHLQSLYTRVSPVLLGFVLSSIFVGFPASMFAGGLWRCSREIAVM